MSIRVACIALAMLSVFSVPVWAVDFTPPIVTPQVSGELGENNWFVSDVAVQWVISDGESEAAVFAGCEPTVISADTASQTLYCSAISSGGITSMTWDVRRDATPPQVAYSNAKPVYGVHEEIAIFCNAYDAVSGVTRSTCQDITGPATAFAATNTFSATATDGAGNEGSASVTFEVVVTTDSLRALIDLWIFKNSLANNLDRRLTRGDIEGFIKTVERESGRNIPPEQAAELIRLARLL